VWGSSIRLRVASVFVTPTLESLNDCIFDAPMGSSLDRGALDVARDGLGH
jgi:hypothetical protein